MRYLQLFWTGKPLSYNQINVVANSNLFHCFCRVLERPNAKAVTFCGSPYYMSPEIFSCKPYDEKVMCDCSHSNWVRF